MQDSDKNAMVWQAETENELFTTYHEQKIGRTMYRITNTYKGEVDLAKAIEDLIVRRILRRDS